MTRFVDITTILSDGKRIRRRVKAPPGRAITSNGIEQVLKQESDRIEAIFPDRNFRLVPLCGGKAFNIVEVRPNA